MTVHSLDVLLSQFWISPLLNQQAVGSWCAYRFLKETGKVVWYSHFFENFPQFVVIHTVKGFRVVSEAEVAAFLEFPCFFYDSTDVSSLISGSSAFSISSLNIWEFLVHVLLKLSLKDFEHYFASLWNESSCVVVWTFFGIALLWKAFCSDSRARPKS